MKYMNTLFAASAMLLMSMTVQAQDVTEETPYDKISVDALTIAPGQEAELTVTLESNMIHSGYNMDVTLPEGLSFITDEDDNAFILPESLTSTHSLSQKAQESDKHYKVIVFSMSKTELPSEILTFKVVADENLADESEILFSKVKFNGGEYFDYSSSVIRDYSIEITGITPDPAASQESPLSSLGQVEITVGAPVTAVNSTGVALYKDGEEFAEGTLTFNESTVTVSFDGEFDEYGHYDVYLPAGAIETATGKSDEMLLSYNVGLFQLAAVSPAEEEVVASLSEVTVFMTARVGGFLDGATINVADEAGEVVTTATLDWATEPYGNDVCLTLAEPITKSGVYTVEIPAGVIFDMYYDEIDSFMSGAKSNEAITLTITVSASVGIDGIEMNQNGEQQIYTINGVNVKNAVKGLNIINGKKMIIK